MPNPEKNVGMPKILSALKEARGLALWRLDIPEKSIAPRALR